MAKRKRIPPKTNRHRVHSVLHIEKREEKVGSVRVNITIPKDLKARMAPFDDVNWSRIAQQAFRSVVDHLER